MTHYPVSVEEHVRFADLDSFGHVNNAVYFTFFEQARLAYMRALGLIGEHAATPGDRNFILLETRCRFLKPCFLADRLQVQARVLKLGESSGEMEYRILRGDEPVAEGTGVVVYFDYAAKRKAPLTPELRSRIAELERW